MQAYHFGDWGFMVRSGKHGLHLWATSYKGKIVPIIPLCEGGLTSIIKRAKKFSETALYRPGIGWEYDG